MMLALTTEFMSHVPVNFLMLSGTVKHFAAETAALVCIFLTNHAFFHVISLTFIITNKRSPIKNLSEISTPAIS